MAPGSRRYPSSALEVSVPADHRLRFARAVEHALTATRPKTRYVVGHDAKMRLFITRVLPTRVMDRGVVRAMGL
jgi:hypothetical protein